MRDPDCVQPPGQLLGRGRSADVFAWGEQEALKLYDRHWPAAQIAYEARIAKIVHAAGAPAPAVGAIIQVAGRTGLVYQRVDGPSLEAVLLAQPAQVVRLARLFALVHSTLHQRTAYNLPVFTYRLQQQIKIAALNSAARQTAQTALEHLRDGAALCHGDFHPGNVLLAAQGPIVIDWENASAGEPAADVARTALLLDHGYLYEIGRLRRCWARFGLALFRTLYLRWYTRFSGVTRAQIEAWRVPVAAARLAEGIVIEAPALRAIVARAQQTDLQ